MRPRGYLLPGLAFCVAAIASAGCGDETPAGPSRMTPPTAAPAPTPVPTPTILVAGTLTDHAGMPVAGAVITHLDNGRRSTQTVSEASGAYSIWVPSTTPDVYLEVEKPGFETSTFFVFLDNSDVVTRDLRLHPLVRVAVGEWAYLVIAENDPVCTFGDKHWVCRRVRIDVTSRESPLTVALGNAVGLPPFRIQLADDPAQGGSELSLPEVTPGQELVVDVLLFEGRGPHLLELIATGSSGSGWWGY